MKFETINKAYNRIFIPNELSLGIFFAIESYSGIVPTMNNQVALAQKAEDLGFSALWFRDVPLLDPSFGDAGQIYDPWVYLGYIAAQTKSIALVTGSIILPLRHPIHIAKAAASVDSLSQGRLIMGVASGDRPLEYPAFNKDLSKRAELFRESFQYTSSLARHFPSVKSSYGVMNGELDLIPKPVGEKIPMLVTGNSGQSLEWIAEHSDGWIYYPRGIHTQRDIVNNWRATLEHLSQVDKPFAQSFYLDLASDPDTRPVPIHLGYRVGRNWLLEILTALKQIGVNHIVFNLKYGRRHAEDVMEELAAYILPEFNAQPQHKNSIV